MQKFKSIFKVEKPVIGVIHIKALPGTPNYTHGTSYIINETLEEAKIYKRAGIDAIIIENMHDVPYLKGSVGHEVSSLMAVIGHVIKQETALPIGIQILAGANKEAIAVAKSSGLDFIRAEGFVFAHVADEGLFESQAGKLLRYRKRIDAESVLVFTDIKKKHSSHAITEDISLLDTAKAAQFFLSDGVVITGKHTGESVAVGDLKTVNNNLNIPVLIGSGITLDNVQTYLSLCDAMIVGSHFKDHGYWKNALNYERVSKFMEFVKSSL